MEEIYWKKKSKIKKIYPYLADDISPEVLIIGGGITGALTAYFIAKEGINVAIVEKNIIGYGSTIKTNAILEYQSDADMQKLEKTSGKKCANRTYKLSLEAIDLIEKINNEFDNIAEFKRQDAIYFTNKFMQKSNMARECKIRNEAGFKADLLDSHKILNMTSGIITQNASATINPYMFAQGLFENLNHLENVHVYENTEIVEVNPNYDNVECITKNGFKILSDSVIFTSGIDTLKYLEIPDLEIYKNFTIVTNSLRNENFNFTARDCIEPYYYLRFDNDGRIILSGQNSKFTTKFTYEKYFENFASEKYRKLNTALGKILNNISNIKVEFAYSSTYVTTKDSLPIIDEIPGMPNCFCNLAFGSNGIIYSTIRSQHAKKCSKRTIHKRHEHVLNKQKYSTIAPHTQS